jgi:uncharacterized protein (TIRG00374 family)
VSPRTASALRWVFATLVIGLLVVFAMRVDWREIGAILAQAQLRLLVLATLANLASLGLRGVAWWLFLAPWGVRRVGPPLRSTFAGAAMNNILPWNAGDAVRIWALAAQQGISPLHALASAGLERLTALVGGLLLLGFAVWAIDLPDPVASVAHGIVIAAAVALLLYLLVPRRWLAAAGRSRLVARLSRPREMLRQANLTKLRLAVAVVIGLAGWLLQLLTYMWAAAAVGLRPGPGATVMLLVAVNIGFIFRLTPAGVGVFQAVYAATAAALELPADQALAAAILLQAVQVIPVTLLGSLMIPGSLRRSPPGQKGSVAGDVEPATAVDGLGPATAADAVASPQDPAEPPALSAGQIRRDRAAGSWPPVSSVLGWLARLRENKKPVGGGHQESAFESPH